MTQERPDLQGGAIIRLVARQQHRMGVERRVDDALVPFGDGEPTAGILIDDLRVSPLIDAGQVLLMPMPRRRRPGPRPKKRQAVKRRILERLEDRTVTVEKILGCKQDCVKSEWGCSHQTLRAAMLEILAEFAAGKIV